MPHQIEDLRTHLFETLDALRDKTNPLDLDRARAVADVAKVIVDSAKVEVDFLKVTGASHSTNFLPVPTIPPRAPQNGNGARATLPAPSTTPAADSPPRSVVTRNGQEFEVAFDGRQSLIGDRASVAR